jgi:DNA-binding GntR family transcriptional regulator
MGAIPSRWRIDPRSPVHTYLQLRDILLGIPIGSAVLLLGRRSFSGGVPIQYVISTYRAAGTR